MGLEELCFFVMLIWFLRIYVVSFFTSVIQETVYKTEKSAWFAVRFYHQCILGAH